MTLDQVVGVRVPAPQLREVPAKPLFQCGALSYLEAVKAQWGTGWGNTPKKGEIEYLQKRGFARCLLWRRGGPGGEPNAADAFAEPDPALEPSADTSEPIAGVAPKSTLTEFVARRILASWVEGSHRLRCSSRSRCSFSFRLGQAPPIMRCANSRSVREDRLLASSAACDVVSRLARRVSARSIVNTTDTAFTVTPVG